MNINGENNIQVNGNDNEIKILNDKKTKLVLDDIDVRFRNYSIDFYCGVFTFFATLILGTHGGLGLYALLIPFLVAIIYFIYLPKKFPLMYIYVYNDRFKYLVNKEVLFHDIRHYRYRNNGFYWILKGPKERSLTLHNNQNSFFMFDCVERYSISTGTKLY